jgi:FKBP-type peptidyl-prolyl cis-trans isomerase FklB
MLKSLTTAVTTLAAGIMLLGIAQAQQTPPAKTQPAAPAKTTKAAPKAPVKAAAKAPAAALTTTKDKFSYALGMQVGTGLGGNLRKQSVEFDPNLLAQGLKDSLAGGKTRLTPEEAQAVLTQVQADVRKKQQEKMQVEGAANKKQGDEFLAANKTKEGVVTLPSGLQYKILTAGTGAKPTTTDSVVCNYRGTLINGTEFDSSYKRNQPATFPVTGVIKGWTEALQLMPVGSKWQLFIPSGLAYGERGAGSGDIGPNSTLIFEVELLSIQAKEQPKELPKSEEKK